MNPMRTEPAVTVGAVVAAVLGLAQYYGVLDEQGVGVWSPVLLILAPVISGIITRYLVFSPNTIREAGYDPESVKARAADPSVPRCDR